MFQVSTARRRYAQKPLHYTEQLLRAGILTQRGLCTEKLLYTDTFTHRGFYTKKDVLTYRCFYTKRLLRT